MKVLVIGGMGIIGGAITEASYNNGFDVYILGRRELVGKYKELNIKNICCDWYSDKDAKLAVSLDYDVIVDCLVFNKQQLKRDLRICESHCKQYVYISTDAVYNHPDNDVKESNEIKKEKLLWDYGINKREAEEYIEKFADKYSCIITTIRPTITYGDTRIPLGFASRKNEWTLLNRIITNKPVIMLQDDSSLHSVCHASTFGEVVTSLFLNEKYGSQFLHISNDEVYTFDDIYKVVLDILGKKCLCIHIPVDALKKINPSKFNEMKFDKEPTFTLNNSKAKRVCPSANYNIDINKYLSITIAYLKDNFSMLPEDKEYIMLSDLLLTNYKRYRLPLDERKIAEEYVKKLKIKYKLSLRFFEVKRYIIYYLKKILNNYKD